MHRREQKYLARMESLRQETEVYKELFRRQRRLTHVVFIYLCLSVFVGVVSVCFLYQ